MDTVKRITDSVKKQQQQKKKQTHGKQNQDEKRKGYFSFYQSG